MKAFGFAIAAVGAVVMSAAPASAAVFDAFTSFAGTQPQTATTNGRFIYGQANRTTPNVSGAFYTVNSGCFIAGSLCLQQTTGDVPGVTKSTSTSVQYNSVNVPNDRLLAHPGRGTADDLTFLAFVAPVAGQYTVNAAFNIQDINPSGVGIDLVSTTGGGLPLIFTSLGSITGANPLFSYSNTFTLGAFEAIGFGLSNLGNVNNDSTGVQFSVSTSPVPEPATWAMMIGGFGMIGGSMRMRRRKALLALA